MRILVADGYALVAEGLQSLLRAGGFEVVGYACTGLEALELARELHPDLILMDVQMPVCNGLEATRLIKTEFPEIQVVMLTASVEHSDLFDALKSGASGYLLKNLKSNVLFNYIVGLTRGEAPLSPEFSGILLREFSQQANALDAYIRMLNRNPVGPDGKRCEQEVGGQLEPTLTKRQKEILEMVATGSSYKEVGATLHLSENTVKYHMGGIVRRLNQKNREQVVAYAVSTGLVRRSEVLARNLKTVDT
jgi:two-component system NarL family response regulator